MRTKPTIGRAVATALTVAAAGVSAGCVPKAGVDGVKDAGTSTCSGERHLIEQAVEAYYVLEGELPPSEAALVPNYLRTESVTMDLDADGNVVAAPGSGCI
ncbi:MAG: hypothetical protein HY826_00555 [Actinobacteria bacterium]|nr:hypothetical protein [Actinomycetota bacterium]